MEIDKTNAQQQLNLEWIPYKPTKPLTYGKYLVCRKDGKVHWETWNGTSWAYNNNEIRYWLVIPEPPIKFDNIKI